jgi:Predicted pyridoxal phosphate-dependent enzyme apparently involved in regulation of cell wall biogenesis
MDKIPYGKQEIINQDLDAVVKALQAEVITQGPVVEKFEQQVAEYHGAKYGIAFTNGTAALHAAYHALGTQPCDEIIAPAMTFVASSNAGIYCGAKPVLVDIDLATNNIDIAQMQAAITDKTKVVCAVSIAGYPVDTKKISEIIKEQNIGFIHDCAHGIGSKRNFETGVEYADFTMLSFHPVKHITTGEGGMLLTNNPILAEKARLFRTHGITKNPDQMRRCDGTWHYDMIELGFNLRIPDIQCALGISQFERIKTNLLTRNLLAKRYNEAFKNTPELIIPPAFAELTTITETTDISELANLHAYHLYTMRVQNAEIRKELFDYLHANKIFVQIHYLPVSWHTYYQTNFNYQEGDFPNAEKYYTTEISLPMYHSLSFEEQDYVIEKILDFFNNK